MAEGDHAEPGVGATEEADHQRRIRHAQLVALACVGGGRFVDLEGEADRRARSARLHRELESGGVDVEEACDGTHGLLHGVGVAGDHCDGAEDGQSLPAHHPEAKVVARQFLGAGGEDLQHRREGDQCVVLALDALGQGEACQEGCRVPAQLTHQVGKPPQAGGSDQAAHRAPAHVRK